MKNLRRFAACLLACSLMAALCGAAGAIDFTDTIEHWARQDISRAHADGYLTGDAYGDFWPDEALTAAQFFTILARVHKLPDAPETETAADPAAWYYEAAQRAVAAGMAAPDFAAYTGPVTRGEALALSARSFGLTFAEADTQILAPYADAAALDKDARPLFAGLVERELLCGWDGGLRLDESLTRAQFVTLLYRMMDFHEPTWRAAQEARREEEQTKVVQADEALALVGSRYAGDYTLAWAEQNDYSTELKEAWINLHDYASDTPYLIWVSIETQRANVFEGGTGAWRLLRHSIVATGRAGTDTPQGVWKVTYHNETGWTTGTYTVRPVLGFKDGGYAFHSWLYAPGTWTVQDASMGFPVSMGCVRMFPEDIAWLFDNIPVGTTVVVY